MSEIDRLEVSIESSAKEANSEIDSLISKLKQLSSSIENVKKLANNGFSFKATDTSKVLDEKNLANSASKAGKAMQNSLKNGINASGVGKEVEKELSNAYAKAEKAQSKASSGKRYDRADLKYKAKDIDSLFDKYSKAGLGSFDFSQKSILELNKELKSTGITYEKLQQRLNKKLATENVVNYGKAYENLAYDMQYALNKMEALQNVLNNKKTAIPDFTINRGDSEPTTTIDSGNKQRSIPVESMGYNTDAIRFVEEYGTAVDADVSKTQTFETRIKSLREQLKSLEGNGFVQGTEQFDAVKLKLEEVIDQKKRYDLEMKNQARLNVDMSSLDGDSSRVNTLTAQIQRLKHELTTATANGFSEGMPQYDSIMFKLRQVEEEKKRYDAQMRQQAKIAVDTAQLVKAETQMSKAGRMAKAFKTALGSMGKTVTGLANVSKEFKKMQKNIQGAMSTVSKMLHPLRTLRELMSTGSSGGGRGQMGLFNMIKSSLLFSTIFGMISKIKQAITDGSNNLVQYSNAYNHSISSMVTSLNYLKNAWAVAFAPIVNVVAPYISAFIDMIASALNWVGQLMAALTGKGKVVQAKKAWTNYGASLGDTSSAASDAGDSLGKAAKQAKKFQDYTLGIDELNVQPQTDSSSSSGGGTGGSGASPSGSGSGAGSGITDMFETIEVSDSVKSLADRLKDAWESGDFTSIGRSISNKLAEALESIDWNSVYKVADKFGKGLATFLNGLITPRLFCDLGATIANSINTALHAANAFAINFDWSNFGESIASSLTGFFENFDAKLSAETFSHFYSGILKSMTSFLNKLGDDETFKTIGQKLADFICNIDYVGLAWDLVNFFDAVGNAIMDFPSDFLDGFWEGVKENLEEKTGIKIDIPFDFSIDSITDNIEKKTGIKIDFGRVFKFYLPAGLSTLFDGIDLAKGVKNWIDSCDKTALENFPTTVMEIFKAGFSIQRFQEIGANIGNWFDTSIKPWFSADKWSQLGTSAITSLKTGIGDIKSWFEEKFRGAYTKVQEAFSGIGEWFAKKYNAVKQVFSPANVKDYFKTQFTNAYTKVREAFQSINTWFQQKYNAVKQVFSTANVKDYFKTQFEAGYKSVRDAFSAINTWFKGKWDDVKKIFGIGDGNNVKTYFEKIFDNAYKLVFGDDSPWYGIKSFFYKIAKKPVAIFNSMVNTIKKAINWIIGKLGGTKIEGESSVSLPSIKSFKTGTSPNGVTEDTLAVVNDQNGTTYKEMIVPPHGEPFIPEGRNVMLPLEKGTRVMTASETQEVLERRKIPQFKNGVGSFLGSAWAKISDFTGSIMDYFDNPKKIVQIALDKFVDTSSWTADAIKGVGVGAMNKVADTAVKFVKKAFGSGKVEKALKWAIGIANDNSHGYDQTHRTGPDYDCSSLVTTALKRAGFKIGVGTTSSMPGQLRDAGFKNVIGSVNVGNQSGLKRGDVLLNSGHHTAFYLGGGKIVHARINEKGTTKGGKTGDQTGKEIMVGSYHNHPWTSVWRVKGFKNGVGKFNLADIPQYEVGGFVPEDGLFAANSSELIGKFSSNGRTAVANNEMIIDGIEEAAYRGFKRASEENTTQETLLEEIRDAIKAGKQIMIDGRELVSIVDKRRSRNGYAFT